MSKEHIWSDWLSELINHTKPTHNHAFMDMVHLGDLVVVHHRFENKPRQGSPLQRKIRKVCESCNNGWMSTVVAEAKPSASALIQGKSVSLSPSAQNKLSTWITLTSMMAEFTDPQTAKVSHSEFIDLEKLKSALPNWTIGIARYSGTEWAPSRYRHYGGQALVVSDAAAVDFQLTTFTLGNLAVHAVSSRSEKIVSKFRQVFFRKSLVQIWPFQSALIDSENLPIISDHELLSISAVYGRL